MGHLQHHMTTSPSSPLINPGTKNSPKNTTNFHHPYNSFLFAYQIWFRRSPRQDDVWAGLTCWGQSTPRQGTDSRDCVTSHETKSSQCSPLKHQVVSTTESFPTVDVFHSVRSVFLSSFPFALGDHSLLDKYRNFISRCSPYRCTLVITWHRHPKSVRRRRMATPLLSGFVSLYVVFIGVIHYMIIGYLSQRLNWCISAKLLSLPLRGFAMGWWSSCYCWCRQCFGRS